MQRLNIRERQLVKMWNKAREQSGMPLLQIKIRNCLKCGCQFESTGDRRCGTCKSMESGIYESNVAFDMALPLEDFDSELDMEIEGETHE